VSGKRERELRGELDRSLGLAARVRAVLGVALIVLLFSLGLAQIADLHAAWRAGSTGGEWAACFAGLGLRATALLCFWVARAWIPEVMAQQAWRHFYRRQGHPQPSELERLLPR
jgi:hypothetical protein